MTALDAAALSRATGWRVHVHETLASTNDEATRLREAGAPARTAVLALAQTAGRGRAGRAFVSPAGGLYVSLLVPARTEDLPGALVAASALAAAEGLEAVSGQKVALKWPNDLWIGRRKVGGILLEAAGRGLVTVGVGVNVERVPAGLPAEVQAAATALVAEAGRPVPLTDVLVALLAAVDRRLAQLARPAARQELLSAWRARLLLLGEQVVWREGGFQRHGRFLDASLEGLVVQEDGAGPRTLRSEHVQELRPLDGGPGPQTAGDPSPSAC